MTRLALFDLDHTLLPFDSDYEWGQFLVGLGVVDGKQYAQQMTNFTKTIKLANSISMHSCALH